MNKVTMFTDAQGLVSMRRVLAFIFALDVIASGLLCEIKSADWKMALIITGVPLVGSVLMLLFTSWSDIASVARAIKKGE